MAGNVLQTGNTFLKGKEILSFLVAFAKLRKATISFIMTACLSTRPSFRMKQLGAHWTDFHEFLYLNISRKSAEEIQTSLISDKNNGCFT
jgi:hypothetical protein